MDPHEEFLRLLLRHQSDVKAFIGSLIQDRHLRDDVFQEVALVLWQEFARYDRSRSFGAWARGIAVKKVLQRWEKSRRLLALRYDQALKLGQIAQRVGATVDAVHKALSRIRTRLQKCIERRLLGAAEGTG